MIMNNIKHYECQVTDERGLDSLSDISVRSGSWCLNIEILNTASLCFYLLLENFTCVVIIRTWSQMTSCNSP